MKSGQKPKRRPAQTPTDPLYAANWGHDNRGQLPAYNSTITHSHTGAPAGLPADLEIIDQAGEDLGTLRGA